MSYSKLHDQDFVIQIKSGLAANINATATKNVAVEGEPHWATDTKRLYIFDGTQNIGVVMLDISDQVLLDMTAADKINLIIKAAAAQTANLQEWQDSSGNVLTKIASDGFLTVPSYERHIQIPAFLAGTPANQPTATTVGTAGGLQFGFAADKTTYVQWEVPDDWVGGEDMYIEIDWLPDGGAIDYTGSSETVNWTITYRSIAEGETITNGTAVAVPITSAEDLSQYQTKHTRFTLDYDNANQPITKQDHIYFEIKRDVSEDSYNGTVVVTAFEILYNSTSLPTSN